MANKQELVFVTCAQEGCTCQRMFLKNPKEELQEYVCIKHRRVHRVVPHFNDVVVKSGLLLKKGARSSSYIKRCAVLLKDRIVIYDSVGDQEPLACINLNGAEIQQDSAMKKRFNILCNKERRKFSFESVLDVDHANWFFAIKTNISLLKKGSKFRSWDEDDYIAPGTPITPDIKRPPELMEHHAAAVAGLQEAIKPRLVNGLRGDNNQTLSLSIWAGTWNMGEADPPFNLEEWVPDSFDLIAVGVEECMKLPDLEMRCNGVIGSDYVYYTEKVGSTHKEVGFHGYIAVTVFIRIDLIQAGLVPVSKIVTKNVALGKNLVVTRASNKGGVRVRCPLELGALGMEPAMSTQVDFICCHLASDQKGVTKIAKRNKNAVELVQALVLDDTENLGYVFAMGDMNYRINMAPEDCMDLIVAGVGHENPDAYCALLDNDQLIPCLATAATFPGFQELTLPTFAPTYKKKKGESGDPKGYTDRASVYGCYDYVMKDAGSTLRTPSFTDRILFQAYPTNVQSNLFVYKYSSIDKIRDSDHSPVYGAVSLRIGPNSAKGHIFKKLISTIPIEQMMEVASQDNIFRVLINNQGILEPMSKQLLREVSQFFSPAYIHRDTLIIKAGDSASSSLLFVVRGSVKLITEKYELVTVGPGQWFGGEALIEDVSGYTAIAEEDTVCLSLNVNAVDKMMKKGYREFALSVKRMVMGQSVAGLVSILGDMIQDYDEDTINLLRYQLTTTYIDKDQVLCNEGDDLATAFYVVGGQVTITMRQPNGEPKVIARLGPGAVVGNELLCDGNTAMYTIKTSSPTIVWSLTRENFKTYLTLDEEQVEALRGYDQNMFHWVNTNQLPLNGMKLQILKLISDVFGGQIITAGQTVWMPSMKEKKLSRVLITGKAVVGADMSSQLTQTDNEFDIDLSVMTNAASQKVVGSGCILNQFTEQVRAIQDCVVIDVDKKTLKKLCMLIRWKFFGMGAANYGLSTKPIDFKGYAGVQICVNDLDGIRPMGATRVILTGVDSMAQPVSGEEVTTKDLRASPYFWAESHRFGTGAMGIEGLAGVRVQIVQGLGRILGDGMVPLDVAFGRMDKDGYIRHVVKLKNDKGGTGTLFLTMKGLSAQDMSASLQERPLEDIAVSRQPQDVAPKEPENLLQKLASTARRGQEELTSRMKSFRKEKGGKDQEGVVDGEEEEREVQAEKGKKEKKGKKGKGKKEEYEEEDMPMPPPPRKGKDKGKGRGRPGEEVDEFEEEEEEYQGPRGRRPPPPLRRGPPGGPPGGPPPLPGRPALPPRGGAGTPPPPPDGGVPPAGDSKAKKMVSGLLARFGLGKKQGAEKPAEEAAGVPPPRRRPGDEEEFDEEEDYGGRGGFRGGRGGRGGFRGGRGGRGGRFEDEFEEEEEDIKARARKGPKGRKIKIRTISSDEEFSEESEPEPQVPEGKPTPFHTGKRIPYIPPTQPNANGNPFARSCGNPFAPVGLTPPQPTVSPKPGAANPLFAEMHVEEEEDLPAEPAKKPTPRPGYNPFAAKQEGDYGNIVRLMRRPNPTPGFNPFAVTKVKAVIINGKERTNPFV